MKRGIVFLTLVLSVAVLSGVHAQNNRALQAYVDRFQESSPEVKLQILESADMLSAEELGPLYVEALQFALANSDQLDTNSVIREIALFATREIGEGGYSQATGMLWRLFQEYPDNTSRILVLDVLGRVGTGSAQAVADVNGWVRDQANLNRGGVQIDRQVLRKAVQTLGVFADESSFAVLLDVQLARISDPITADARASMEVLPGDYADRAIETINARSIADRLDALNYFLGDPALAPEERSSVAAGVLEEAIRERFRLPSDVQAQRVVRYVCVNQLIDVPVPGITNLLVDHFDLTFTDYGRGMTTKTWVLEAIAALGATGTERAAERLTELLDLLNTYTETSGPYDTQIMLAVVTNLQDLGSMVAYDALFTVRLLDYPERVREAAREALDALSE